MFPFLGCATDTVTGRERLHLELRYNNLPRQLAVSLHVSPFFRDANRRLLSEEHPDEVLLLVTPRGERIPPGDAIEVLPAGTQVRTLRILFPSKLGPIARPLLTPSDRIWVELAVEGRPASPAYVLVLTPDLNSEEKVIKALDRYLTPVRLDSEVASMSEEDQATIRSKELREGVSARALELAFRTPTRKNIYGEGSAVKEEWIWRYTRSQQTAWLEDGVVVRVAKRQMRLEEKESSSPPAPPSSSRDLSTELGPDAQESDRDESETEPDSSADSESSDLESSSKPGSTSAREVSSETDSPSGAEQD